VYSYGHRNVFGLAEDPETRFLWQTENGPSQDDEVNRIVAGANYGWPNVTGVAGRPEFTDPEFVFPSPLPALTQATFLGGFLYFGAWNSGTVYRATLSGDRRSIDRVDAIHRFSGGITDVEAGPDGRLYVSVVNSPTGDGIFAITGETASGGDHWLVYGIAAAAIAALVLIYVWRRRRLRRERS
jgi:glucose/arabinose dehydrogenase